MQNLALIVEIIGIVIVIYGIKTELSTDAHFGHVIITTGSLLIATGGLLWAKIFI